MDQSNPPTGGGPDGEQSDLETAVRTFLDDAETVLDEYEQGYADADVALSLFEGHVSDLRSAVED